MAVGLRVEVLEQQDPAVGVERDHAARVPHGKVSVSLSHRAIVAVPRARALPGSLSPCSNE
jgi:hypothetical protein